VLNKWILNCQHRQAGLIMNRKFIHWATLTGKKARVKWVQQEALVMTLQLHIS